MRGFALAVLAGAMVVGFMATVPKANAQVGVGVEIGPPQFVLTGTTRFPLTTALRTATMGRSGSQAVYSSAQALGSMGRNISTDTSIIVSIFARGTTGRCRREASAQRNTAQSFTARQCMTHAAMRPLEDTGK